MNREIKFRAWDKKQKKMIRFGLYSLLVDGWEKDSHWERHYNNALIDLELMQYTGLNDKDGKEIYEGDIYIVNHYYGWSEKEDPYIIETLQKFFENKGYSESELGEDWKPENICVIGNIYENPELLTNRRRL